MHQIRNTEEIFQLNRIRSPERRLLMLLRWLGVRFGQVSSRGYRLSLKEMNLTHRPLAEHRRSRFVHSGGGPGHCFLKITFASFS